MRPWERYWFRYWQSRNITRKDREIHRLERALLIWPAHVFARWRTRRTTRTAPKGAFFMGENNQEGT